MSASEFAGWMNPVLDALRDLGGTARPQEVVDLVAKKCGVSDSTLDLTIAGGVSRFMNQVHWARYYLAEVGYIDRSRKGVWKLTELARSSQPLSTADIDQIINQVQEAKRAEREATKSVSVGGVLASERDSPRLNSDVDEIAPEENSGSHSDRLLTLLKSLPPSGFERLCQRLLREAGFEKVTVTGRSGDGGIDGHGVLAVNPFVSFRVLFQCKRYEGSVGPGQVRDFRGAMQGRADKGIVLTTGTFTAEARREAIRDGVPPLELVDGEKLIQLFENLELGLTPKRAFELDEHFFDEYRQ